MLRILMSFLMVAVVAAFAHSNPDYTKRLNTESILTELKKIR